MRSRTIGFTAGVSFAALIIAVMGAQAQTVALSGTVSSAQEGAMEGVLVNVKQDGSTITTTVVTDDQGRYSFPAERLAPGKYTVSIRAVGYVLDGPKAVEIGGGKDANADLKLAKARNVKTQLTNAEWLNSAHGTAKEKLSLNSCGSCHTLQRIFMSSHDTEEWKQVFTRMEGYAQGSQPQRPQLLPPGGRANRDAPDPAFASYLASISLNGPEAKEFEIKTEPRPKGRATKVIITEYDLPRKEALPHDVVVDADGKVWYSDFGSQFVGELDPKTGKATDYPIEVFRPEQPKGSLDIELAPDGSLWLAMMYQAGLVHVDRKTKKITPYPYPKEWLSHNTQTSMVSPQYSNVDGKVWTNNQETRENYRLDLASGKYENLGISKDPRGKNISGYGMPTDHDNNVFMLEFSGTSIGRRNAKTGEITIWPTPTAGSKPRRGRFDEQNRLWFAEYGSNGIGMFDPKSDKITEWVLPTKWDTPYDVVPARNGEVWTGSMHTDLVTRLDTKTNTMTQYLLPRTTNIRRVFVEETGPRPVLWVGSNHGASIVKVEPLD